MPTKSKKAKAGPRRPARVLIQSEDGKTTLEFYPVSGKADGWRFRVTSRENGKKLNDTYDSLSNAKRGFRTYAAALIDFNI